MHRNVCQCCAVPSVQCRSVRSMQCSISGRLLPSKGIARIRKHQTLGSSGFHSYSCSRISSAKHRCHSLARFANSCLAFTLYCVCTRERERRDWAQNEMTWLSDRSVSLCFLCSISSASNRLSLKHVLPMLLDDSLLSYLLFLISDETYEYRAESGDKFLSQEHWFSLYSAIYISISRFSVHLNGVFCWQKYPLFGRDGNNSSLGCHEKTFWPSIAANVRQRRTHTLRQSLWPKVNYSTKNSHQLSRINIILHRYELSAESERWHSLRWLLIAN